MNIGGNKIFNILSRNRDKIKNSGFYFGASFFHAIIGLLIFPLQSMYLNHTDYAIIGYFGSFTSLITPILNFSLINYYLRKYFLIPDDKREYVLNAIMLTLLVYGIVSLIIVLIAFYAYMEISDVPFPFWPYALLAFLPLYFDNFFLLYQVRCRMTRKAQKFFYITTVKTLLIPLFTFLFVVLYNWGALGKFWSVLLPSIVVGSYCLFVLFDRKIARFDTKVIKEAISFGWPISLSTMIWYFCGGIDKAILAPLNDNYNMGLYTIGLQISNFLMVFYFTITQTFEPDLYQAIANDNKPKLIKFVLLIVGVNAFVNLIFVLVCPFVFDILTAHRFVEASDYAQITTLRNITNSLYFILNTVLIGYGFTKSSLGIRIISAVACIIMYYFMIGHWGFIGAAWGQVLSFVIMSTFTLLYMFYLHTNGKLVVKKEF